MICPFCIKPYNLQPKASLRIVFQATVVYDTGCTQHSESAADACPDCWDELLGKLEKYEHELVKAAREAPLAAAAKLPSEQLLIGPA